MHLCGYVCCSTCQPPPAVSVLLLTWRGGDLQGVTDIKDMVDRVKEGESRTTTYRVAGAAVVRPTVWLNPERMSAWLSENKVSVGYVAPPHYPRPLVLCPCSHPPLALMSVAQRSPRLLPGHSACVRSPRCVLVGGFFPPQIVDICLGGNVDGKVSELHVEILKRLPTIVHFAVRCDRITDAQVELLWKGKPATQPPIFPPLRPPATPILTFPAHCPLFQQRTACQADVCSRAPFACVLDCSCADQERQHQACGVRHHRGGVSRPAPGHPGPSVRGMAL
jgi:hypothetical protein